MMKYFLWIGVFFYNREQYMWRIPEFSFWLNVKFFQIFTKIENFKLYFQILLFGIIFQVFLQKYFAPALLI